jgi:hypothetical protein
VRILSNYPLSRQAKVSGKSLKIPMLVRESMTGERSKRTSGLDSSEKLKVTGAGQENNESSGVAAAHRIRHFINSGRRFSGGAGGNRRV